MAHFPQYASGAWEVLMLFLIPIGGGIPAGVLMARSKGIDWWAMSILYFISDVILACVFEPIMKFVIALGKHSPFINRFRAAFKQAMSKTPSPYRGKVGPFGLVLISFGSDPMTGRAATAAAGYGFVTGWLLAIIGDMFYFAVVMISTLWLSHILGDGTWATLAILLVMTAIPLMVRRLQSKD